MESKKGTLDLNRRRLITGLCATGALTCLGCGRAARAADGVESAEHGFSAASGMSFEEVFNFAYARSFIPTMKNLAERVGMEVIQNTACETAAQVIGGFAASLPDRRSVGVGGVDEGTGRGFPPRRRFRHRGGQRDGVRGPHLRVSLGLHPSAPPTRPTSATAGSAIPTSPWPGRSTPICACAATAPLCRARPTAITAGR